jgi:hypothetical protein
MNETEEPPNTRRDWYLYYWGSEFWPLFRVISFRCTACTPYTAAPNCTLKKRDVSLVLAGVGGFGVVIWLVYRVVISCQNLRTVQRGLHVHDDARIDLLKLTGE